MVSRSGSDSGFPSAPWLARALVVSVALHAAIVWFGARALAPAESIPHVERVDIEIAPAPPVAEALPAEQAAEDALPTTAMATAEPPRREATLVDTVVVSTPRPHDATATTLVVHTTGTRAQMRELLASPDAPITWSTARGGSFGKRSSAFAGDTRVVLSPWRGWYVLAPATDFGD